MYKILTINGLDKLHPNNNEHTYNQNPTFNIVVYVIEINCDPESKLSKRGNC